MRRLLALLSLTVLVTAGCGRAKNDLRELRGHLRKTGDGARIFTYSELSKERAFTIRGEVEDDLRFRMVLSTSAGDLVEEVVSDDALAVRVLQPQILTGIGSPLGSIKLDEAIRAGRWAMSPSGAPPLQRQGSTEDTGESLDPFAAALEDLRYVANSLSQAQGVREWNLEDLDYRPQEDPWLYPDKDRDEKRYDVLRPELPKREEQLGGPTGQGDVTTATFRKLSAFVKKGKVYRVCELVDVANHEEYVRVKKKNKFVRDLVTRVLEGKSARPIRQREVVREVEFPESVKAPLPGDAIAGSLEPLQQALQQSIEGGLLAPAPGSKLTNCDRRGETKK